MRRARAARPISLLHAVLGSLFSARSFAPPAPSDIFAPNAPEHNRMSLTYRAAPFAFLLASATFAQRPQGTTRPSNDAIPSPASILGFDPGSDRHLPTWKQVTDYFTTLDKASPRVSVRTLGKTTLGRPFIVAFISDSATLRNLERYRQIQRKLADPRLQAADERARLLDEGKNVILITSSIHSTAP